MPCKVDQLLTGAIRPYGPNGEVSGYRKYRATGSIAVTATGLAGDAQADLKHHGGADKAVLHYAFDHYATWRSERPELQEHFAAPGAFGENISTSGCDETSVCIGDRYTLGSAVVEVSQGRQPCWKLGHRFDCPDMIKAVIATGRCGWYYRVVESGSVQVGDTIELTVRPYPNWTVAKVFQLLVGDTRNQQAFEELSQLNELAISWRERARSRLKRMRAAD